MISWNDQVLEYLRTLVSGIIASLTVATGYIKGADAATGTPDANGTSLIISSGASTGTGSSGIDFYTTTPNTTTDGYITLVGETPTAAGADYVAGDILEVDQGVGGTVKVLTVDGNGGVLTIELASPGSSGYTVGNGKATTGLNGAGCTIAIGGIANADPVGPTLKAKITGEGNTVIGPGGALATTATDGFLHIPICAGTPTGTPTTYSGKAAMVYDASNNKLYVYDGVWAAFTSGA